MAAPTLTPPPTPAPNRSMTPSVFSAAADARVAWQPTNVSEMQTALTFVDTSATTASNAATSASTSASTATTQATKAQDYAVRTGSVVPSTSDWSAKEHAVGTSVTTGSAKDWATKTSGTVAGTDYSAKYYAQQSQISAAAAQAAAGLPSLGGNEGKALTVNSTATGVEWSAVQSIGDVLVTAKTLTAPKWLLCDGSVYLKSSYATLSGLLGSIQSNTPWTSVAGGSIGGASYSIAKAPNGNLITNDGANTSAHYSTDGGVSWSTSTMTINAQLFAAGNTAVVGTLLNTDTTSTTVSTTNGTSWTAGGTFAGTYCPECIASNGVSNFVIGGRTSGGGDFSTDEVRYSTNSGTTFNTGTTPVSGKWAAVGFGNSMFMMADRANGYIITSPDGVTWTNKTALGVYGANAVAYGASKWLVGITSGGATTFKYSTDNGATWNTSGALPEYATVFSLTYVTGVGFVAGANTGRIFVSVDGINNWTKYIGDSTGKSYRALVSTSAGKVVGVGDGTPTTATIFSPFGYDTTTSFAVPTINSSTAGGVRTYIKGAA